MHQKTLIVIGGGAAGFFCAINAARLHADLKVMLLEKSNKVLSKVRVSGGGRCNVTHACFEISDMIKRYPRGLNFVKRSFHRFFTTDTIQWFRERGVRLKKEADGRMFPDTDSAETIIECLMREASRYQVEIRLNAGVSSIEKNEKGFIIRTTAGNEVLEASYVCVACGGYPKAAMFDWLAGTGHTVASPVPSLFTFNIPSHPVTALMGVSVPEARVKIMGSKLEQEGALLITHWGLSGPAVLKLSAWGARELSEWGYDFKILVNWIPSQTEATLREHMQQQRFDKANQKITNRNAWALPQRLWDFMLQQSGVREDSRWADLPVKEQNRLIRNLTAFEFHVKGKTTFKEEFVTAGGIRLAEINANTMMSRKIPDLYFAGETMDVDGVTGGFNFQHAWTSGWIAAHLGQE